MASYKVIPPVPSEPVIEFKLTRDEAVLIRSLLGRANSNEVEQMVLSHCGSFCVTPPEGDIHKIIDTAYDAFYEAVNEADA